MLKQYIIKELSEIIDRINSDTCELTQEQLEDILKMIAHKPMSKEQACTFMHMSRSMFDTKVKDGIIPKGRKRQGFKELVWYEDELEKCTIKRNDKNI